MQYTCHTPLNRNTSPPTHGIPRCFLRKPKAREADPKEIHLTKPQDWIKYYSIAGVVELADTLRSGRSEHSARESSNLSFGINATKPVAFLLLSAARFDE